MINNRYLCLTLDLENDWYFDDSNFDHLTFQYIDKFVDIIQSLNVPLSIFVVGRTLERFPDEVKVLLSRLDCEFHLHSYQHDTEKNYDFRQEVRRGMDTFSDFFGYPPIGYRAPQGNIEQGELTILAEEGFKFDSSVFPSYRPGIYNNLTAPLEPYVPKETEELYEVPVGAFPVIRVPISHGYFKLLGEPLCRSLSAFPLSNFIVYNLHLQDLFRTASHDQLTQPKQWIMKRNMSKSVDVLKSNISRLKRRGYEPLRLTTALDRYVSS